MKKFLGKDGKYHPKSSFLGVHGPYEEPISLVARKEKRNQGNVSS